MASKQTEKSQRQWEALIICPNRTMSAELASLLCSEVQLTGVVEWNEYPKPQELTAGTLPSLCFLDIGSDQDQPLRILSQLRDRPSAPAVIALVSESNPELVLKCLRRGASGFLERPFTAEQLHPVLERIAGLRPGFRSASASSCRVYFVVPAKGSCGATTIASNLAYQTKLLGTDKVLLADMDPLTSTVPFLLKLETQYTFLDALAHARELDKDLWKALVTSYRGFDVLLSPESPLDGAFESKEAGGVMEYCRRIYGTIFVDGGSPYGAWNLRLAGLSDFILLVVTPEIPAVYGAQRTLAYLDRNGVARSKIRLVVNLHRRDAGLDREEIEQALRLEVFHLLPNDREATENALLEGRPVAANSQFGKSLAELAVRLSDREAPAKKPVPAGGLLSLFSR